jgi:hypothetical protein
MQLPPNVRRINTSMTRTIDQLCGFLWNLKSSQSYRQLRWHIHRFSMVIWWPCDQSNVTTYVYIHIFVYKTSRFFVIRGNLRIHNLTSVLYASCNSLLWPTLPSQWFRAPARFYAYQPLLRSANSGCFVERGRCDRRCTRHAKISSGLRKPILYTCKLHTYSSLLYALRNRQPIKKRLMFLPGYGPIAIADWSIIVQCHLLDKHGF